VLTFTTPDRTKDGLSDDPELEIAMLKAVNTAQAWAKRGSEQLDKSKSIFLGPLIKRDLKPLISHGKYEDQVDAITGTSGHLRRCSRLMRSTLASEV